MQLSLNYSMGCAWLHEMGTEKGNVSRLGEGGTRRGAGHVCCCLWMAKRSLDAQTGFPLSWLLLLQSAPLLRLEIFSSNSGVSGVGGKQNTFHSFRLHFALFGTVGHEDLSSSVLQCHSDVAEPQLLLLPSEM